MQVSRITIFVLVLVLLVGSTFGTLTQNVYPSRNCTGTPTYTVVEQYPYCYTIDILDSNTYQVIGSSIQICTYSNSESCNSGVIFCESFSLGACLLDADNVHSIIFTYDGASANLQIGLVTILIPLFALLFLFSF